MFPWIKALLFDRRTFATIVLALAGVGVALLMDDKLPLPDGWEWLKSLGYAAMPALAAARKDALPTREELAKAANGS